MLVSAQSEYTTLAILVLPQTESLRKIRDTLGWFGEDELNDPMAIRRVDLCEGVDLSGQLARTGLVSITLRPALAIAGRKQTSGVKIVEQTGSLLLSQA
jgi:hypothetical protein